MKNVFSFISFILDPWYDFLYRNKLSFGFISFETCEFTQFGGQ